MSRRPASRIDPSIRGPMSTPEPDPTLMPPSAPSTGTLLTTGHDEPATRPDTAVPPPSAPAQMEAGGRYEVLRFHARGGMGEVSVALDREVGREVAYKEIRPQFVTDENSVRRFLLEAEVTGRLEHPGI